MLILGFDPSLRNWGFAAMNLTNENELYCLKLGIFDTPEFETKTPQNVQDATSAQYLYKQALPLVKEADFVVAEYPFGSQSSRAMASYAVCMGVIGSLSYTKPIHRVTPWQVKEVTGNKLASKSEMIQWAAYKHPEAEWPSYKNKGKALITQSKAEHMADAIATIYAGMRLPEFQTIKEKETQ